MSRINVKHALQAVGRGWISRWRRIAWCVQNRERGPRPLQVERLWRVGSAGEPMEACDAVVIDHEGIVADRYHDGHGHWKHLEACVLTCIERRIAAAGEKQGRAPGWHRRNVEISGLDLDGRRVRHLRGALLRVSHPDDVVAENPTTLRLERPRPPCGWLDQVSGRGAARALGWDAGWCLRVEQPGRLNVGDRLSIILLNAVARP